MADAFGNERPTSAAEAFGAPKQRGRRLFSRPAPEHRTVYATPRTAPHTATGRGSGQAGQQVADALTMFERWARASLGGTGSKTWNPESTQPVANPQVQQALKMFDDWAKTLRGPRR